jgi:transcriptional regulator with XRE-family HTH domain
MADEVPSAFGLALTYLRSARGWTQTRLAQAAGIAKSLVTRYEKGRELIRETLDRLLGVLGYPREAADALVFAHRLIFPDPLEDGASPLALTPEEQRDIDRACMATGLLAAEEMRAELVRKKKVEKAAAKRQEAEELWERLKAKAASDAERRDLVADFPDYRSWALAVRVCEASVRAAADKPKNAQKLAALALFIAERVAEPEAFRSRLQGYCWAHVGNARRVSEDYDGADAAFARAWELWRAGGDSELLPEHRLLDLEVSLRRAQRRFPQALELLDRARKVSGEESITHSRILLQKEHVLNVMGNIEGALAALAEAAPFIEAAGNPDLLYALRFNMAEDFCMLERYGEVADLLPQVRKLALEQNSERELARVLLLQAKLDAGQGRIEEAMRGLQRVRRDFLDHDLPYVAAVASLDLAVLWLRAGRTAEVRDLAAELEAVFRAKKISREALAALLLFCDAAKRETVTVALVQRTIVDIENARRSASPAA